MTAPLLLLLGLAVLTAGAEVLVRGASAIALRLGLSQLVVGLTVVAFGTSAPELAVSVKAVLAGQGGVAMGNVVGSNIFNVFVILGLTAIICPLSVERKIVRIDMPLMLATSTLFVLLLTTGGGLVRWEATLLVTGLLVYTVWSVVAGKQEAPIDRPTGPVAAPARGGLPVSIIMVVAGLGLLVWGGALLVDSATVIARRFGVSETVIGLTIVAAGTSLPELATSLLAAFRRQADLAIGNVVGSNIFNLLGIAGVSALVTPVGHTGIRWLDLGTMCAAALLLLPLMRSGFRLVRWEGIVLLLGYALYLFLLWPS